MNKYFKNKQSFMTLNRKIGCLIFFFIAAFAISLNAQDKQKVILTIIGYDARVIEGSDYTYDDLETSCDDYKLGFFKEDMFKVFAKNVGVEAGLYFVKEIGKPTAFAVADPLADDSPDGSVIIGKKLFADIVSTDWKKDDSNISLNKFNILQVVLYHELIHIKQLKENSPLKGMQKELDADYRAGYMMGNYAINQKAWALETLERSAKDAVDFLFSKSDYEFNDPEHHGTKVQRATEFLKGFSEATKGVRGILERPESLEVKIGSSGFKIFALPLNPQNLNSRDFNGTEIERVFLRLN